MSKFLICEDCKSMLSVVVNNGLDVANCKEKLKELKANTTEASTEKHIPAVTVDGDTISVQIGSVEHPMLEEHHIMWIYLETKKGGQLKKLNPSEEPIAEFIVKDDKPVAVYEYCNIHGLWKKEL